MSSSLPNLARPVARAVLKRASPIIGRAQIKGLSIQASRATCPRPFAVDAPDGTVDGQLKESLVLIENMIDRAAIHRIAEEKHNIENDIMAQRARMTFAVDAPDGTSDGQVKETLEEIDRIIDYAAFYQVADKIHKEENAELKEQAKKTFAVDAPDGTSDGQLKESLEEIDHIIQFASAYEQAGKDMPKGRKIDKNECNCRGLRYNSDYVMFY
jgi:epoxyqueuosine reductase QueG